MPPWRLWCKGEAADGSSDSRRGAAGYSAGLDEHVVGQGSSSSSICGSIEYVDGRESPAQPVSAWWEGHEAALTTLALRQLGELRELKHLLVSLPCWLPCPGAIMSHLQGLSCLQSLTCIDQSPEGVNWGSKDVLQALGEAATGLRALHMLPVRRQRIAMDKMLPYVASGVSYN